MCRIFEEIGDHEQDAAPFDDLVDGVERQFDVCAFALWLEGQQFADEAQHVAAAFAWGNEQFYLVGEDEHPDFVIVGGGGESENGR